MSFFRRTKIHEQGGGDALAACAVGRKAELIVRNQKYICTYVGEPSKNKNTRGIAFEDETKRGGTKRSYCTRIFVVELH